MAANKTQPTKADVNDFIDGLEPPDRRNEARILERMMRRVTGMKPVIWGDSIIGYGTYHYQYKSGRQGDFFLIGFSPRKSALSVYIMPGFNSYTDLLSRLGKHKHSVSCLYLTKLENIDLDVLEELSKAALEDMKRLYPDWSNDAFRNY